MEYSKYLGQAGLQPIEHKLSPKNLKQRYSSLLAQYNERLLDDDLSPSSFDGSLRSVLDNISQLEELYRDDPLTETEGRYRVWVDLSRLARNRSYMSTFGCEREIAALILENELLESPL